MLVSLAAFGLAVLIPTSFALPVQEASRVAARNNDKGYYDIQGHRGCRGEVVEQTMPAWAQGLISGIKTLEMDNGITKDGHVVVWHDEDIQKEKCKDTGPVTANDPFYPYVGKYIVNLTLAQIKTLDCGSLRLVGDPLQVTYPGTKIQTLPEMFDFVKCAAGDDIYFNIESKIDPVYPNFTATPEIFVEKQLAEFKKSGAIDRITYQSFDWRSLILMHEVYPSIPLSALFEDDTELPDPTSTNATLAASTLSPWFGGIDPTKFPGNDSGSRIANAVHQSFDAKVLSPYYRTTLTGNATILDPGQPGFGEYVNSSMVNTAHSLGMTVAPYTVNRLEVVDWLVNGLGVDSIITDYPTNVRRWAIQQGISVHPERDADKVNACLKARNYGKQ